MGGRKTQQEFDSNDDHVAWLQEMTEKCGLFDEDKALQVVLDYVMEETEQSTVELLRLVNRLPMMRTKSRTKHEQDNHAASTNRTPM